MSSFGLNIGLRALLTAQSALETVGHNISNANTEGYSRQDLQVSAARPLTLRGLELGGGVAGDVVMRTEDALLTRRIVSQASLVTKLTSMATNMSGVEALLGEPGGFGLGGLMDDLFSSVSDLSANPDDIVFRTGVAQSATNLTSQFHQLADGLSQLQSEASQRIDFFTNEVNLRASEILDLNREITQVEATGVSANDLRDQRDLALRRLAEQVDITYHENHQGAVQVLISGQMLVGPTSLNGMYSNKDDEGNIQLFLKGGTQPLTPTGGEVGGLIEFAETFVPNLDSEVDQLARALILESNRAHSTGIPLSGGFSNLSGSHPIQDMDGDGVILNEVLGNSGLPFDIQDGVLYVNIKQLSTGDVVTHKLEIDSERTTVGDLLNAFNSIDELSASLDSVGRLQLNAESGTVFDFSNRLNAAPDANGTFGSGHASVGSANQGPFNLISGSTLDLSGPISSFSVTFNPADFADMSEATANEVVAALNASPDMSTNLLEAVAVGDQVFIQSIGSGSTETFSIDGGTAASTLGFAPGHVANGHDTSIDVKVHGTYTGTDNEVYVFTPTGDGAIGTTAGLEIEVRTADGLPVATLDVGEDYLPGTPIEVAEGISVSFSFGHLSASDQDAFQVDAIADSDTSDVLVGLGINSFFDGTDAETINLRADIADNPSMLAAASGDSAGDNGALLEFMKMQSEQIGMLDASFNEYYGSVVGGVGFDVSATENALGVEEFLAGALDERRNSISGVNVDEELVDMIQFEQAFGAASRFIQVINQLQDEVLRLV